MTALGACGLAITLAAYVVSLRLRAAHRAAYTTPVFVSVLLVVAALAVTRVPVAAYAASAWPLTSFLVPACAALGVTTYKHRAVLREHVVAIAGSLVVGLAVAIGSAVILGRLARLPASIVDIEAMKSVTAPVALQFASIAHVEPALVVAFVVTTGMVGATLGPPLLSLAGVRDPLARGVALGTISHGIGTAQAASEHDLSGAASSVAMCVVAVALACLGAPLLHVLHR